MHTSRFGLLFALLGPLAVSCVEPQYGTLPDDDTGGGIDDPTQLGPDCVLDPGRVHPLSVQPTAIGTVWTVAWTTDQPGVGTVRILEVAQGEVGERVGDSSATLEHEVTLWGLVPYTEYQIQVAVQFGSELVCGEAVTLVTDGLPVALPGIVVEEDRPGAEPRGFTTVAIMGMEQHYAVVLDPRGRYVWAVGGYGIQRAQLGPDGRTVVHNRAAASLSDVGEVVTWSLEGELLSRVQVTGAHTDFALRPDGGMAVLAWTLREFDTPEGLRTLLGDQVIEVDPDGTQRVIWDAFDALPVDLSIRYGEYIVGGVPMGDVEDWSHVNSISWDPTVGAYGITVANLQLAALVDREGETRWLLADDADYSDFSITSPGHLVAMPHSMQGLGDGEILLFNRGDLGNRDVPACAWASRVSLDLDSLEAEETWRYGSEACVSVPFFGQARALPGGSTMVVFSAAGRIDEVSAEGELLWRAQLDLGAVFGYGERTDEL